MNKKPLAVRKLFEKVQDDNEEVFEIVSAEGFSFNLKVDAQEFDEFRKAFDFDEFDFNLPEEEEEKEDEISEEEDEPVIAALRVEVKRTDREGDCLLVIMPAESTTVSEFQSGKLRLEQLLATHRIN